MRILQIGTFLLPCRLSLTELLDEGLATVAETARAAIPGLRPEPPAATSELLYDFHRSQGAQRVPTTLLDGFVVMEGGGAVRLCLSSLGVGFVVTDMEVEDDIGVDLEAPEGAERFKAYEGALGALVTPLIADSCARIDAAVPAAFRQDRPVSALPAGKLLWWHRVLVEPEPLYEPVATSEYGVTCQLAAGATASVGNGFTTARGLSPYGLADVVEALMDATVHWVVLDEANRMLADHLMRLSAAHGESILGVDVQYDDVLRLNEEITLRNLVLAENIRYMANARIRVRDAAWGAWRMQEESQALEDRVNALRELYALHRAWATSIRDDRRNRIIVVLTVFIVAQGIFIWYDFITGHETALGPFPREALAFTVLGAALAYGLAAVYLRYLSGFAHRLTGAISARLRRGRRAPEPLPAPARTV